MTSLAPTRQKRKPFKFRKYQIDDMARFALHDGGVKAWDPGLFKTGAAFVFPQLKGARLTLIVAPEQLHEQIMDEGRDKFRINVRTLLTVDDFYNDPILQEAALQERMTPGNSHSIRCVFHPTLAMLVSHVFDCVECDEAVRMKADESYCSLGVRMMEPRYRHVLTATPIKNRLLDIFWLCSWACGGQHRPASDPNNREHLFWITSYSALGYNAGDMWEPKETEAGHVILNRTIIERRQSHPLYRSELDYGIGKTLVTGKDPDAEATARWPYENSTTAKENFANEHMLIEQNHSKEAEHVAHTGRFKTFKSRTSKICNIHRLWKLLGPVVLRRRKDDIGEAIVPKTIVPIRVKPGTAQQAVYQFHVENRPRIAKNGNEMKAIASVVAQLQNLRQAALCPDTENLSSARLSVFGLRTIIKQTKNPNADEAQTRKAELVARKGEATPFAEEAKVALAILERMAGAGKIDLEKIIAAAPSFEERLRPFLIVQSSPNIRSWTDHSPKQAAILKLIQELISKGEQVVVLSPFQHFSLSLYRRLIEAGVSVCLLDGNISPKKRGALAKQFKKQKFAVLIGGIQSMGEGNSFECASHLILPSIEWAFDKNRQAEDRVHRPITSLKPVTIYAMVTENTIDERLASVYAEKKDSSDLALDGRLFADQTDDINLGQLLSEAIRNFDPTADTISEKSIEEEWEGSLKQKLRIAEQQFREWHPPIVPDITGERVTPREVTAAAKAAGITPVVSLVKCIPSATFAALINDTNIIVVEKCRELFTAYCADHPQYKDWRHAWRAFEPVWHVSRTKSGLALTPALAPPAKTAAQAAADFIDSL